MSKPEDFSNVLLKAVDLEDVVGGLKQLDQSGRYFDRKFHSIHFIRSTVVGMPVHKHTFSRNCDRH